MFSDHYKIIIDKRKLGNLYTYVHICIYKERCILCPGRHINGQSFPILTLQSFYTQKKCKRIDRQTERHAKGQTKSQIDRQSNGKADIKQSFIQENTQSDR